MTRFLCATALAAAVTLPAGAAAAPGVPHGAGFRISVTADNHTPADPIARR
jgi:hypothetical protein